VECPVPTAGHLTTGLCPTQKNQTIMTPICLLLGLVSLDTSSVDLISLMWLVCCNIFFFF